MRKLFVLFCLFLCLFTFVAQGATDWQAVEKVFGRKGTLQDDVFKITFPRSDLKVKIGGIYFDPDLALTSWIAFKQMQDQVMIMGDLVVLDKEIGPVISRLVSNGIQVTAIHNHLVDESPSVIYMHFSGHGSSLKLAETIKSALMETGTPLTVSRAKQSSVIPDWSKVESVLGKSGKAEGDLLKFSFPRAEKITENGTEIPPSMGVATPIGFQMVGSKAVAYGDFVLLANEVNPVIKALTERDITVTAIHNHMLSESPRLFFLHFWGFGEAEKLANGLKAALDKTNSVKK